MMKSKEFAENLIASMQDGFSELDRQGRHLNVNPALCRMTGFTRKELLGTIPPYPFWPEEARQENEQAIHKMLKGQFKEVELTLKRKNEQRFPAIFSPSCLIDKKGNVISYFATVKDITEFKQTDSALKKQMLRNEQILQTTLDGYILADTDGKLLDVNPAYCEMIGYSREELLKMNVRALEMKLSQLEIEERIKRMVKQGKDRFETKHKHKDGSIIDLEVSIVIMQSDETPLVAAFVRDITERNRFETALKESEQKYRSLFENANDAIYLIEPETQKICDCNQKAVEMDGYTADELKNITALDLHPENEHDILPQKFKEVSGKISVSGITGLHHLRKDGRLVPIEVNAGMIQIGDRLLNLSIVRDVTERKNAEEKLLRINRALRMLSECNQTLVRAKEESEFLQDICRHIIQIGGYRLVWMGFAEQDRRKTVRPVAQSGFEEGYLDTVKITWAETKQGRGPTGTAIRTGKPSVCKNILTNPAYAPWRQEAIQRGYASSIALPLISKGRPFGALNIYSTEPDAFNREEAKLLTELADDVAYGITTLRTRTEHERAEEALRVNETRFRALIENLYDVIILFTSEGKIIYSSPSIKRVLGYEVEELIGRSGLEQIHPDDLESANKVFAETFQKPRSVAKFIYRLRHKDGSYRIIEGTGTNLLTEPGVNAMVSNFRDITEGAQMEASLRESEKKFRQLFENANEGITVVQDGLIKFANPKAIEIFGYPKKELFKINVFELIDPRDQERISARYKKRLKGDKLPSVYDCRVMNKEGLTRWLNNNVVEFSWEDKPAFLAFFSDITEHKLAEEALRESEERYRAVVESQTELICRWLPDGTLTFVNDAYCSCFNKKINELIESSFMPLIPDEDQKMVKNHFASINENQPIATHEHRVIMPNREIRWQQWTNRGIFDNQGRLIEFQSVGRDITERKLAEEALRLSVDELKTLNSLSRQLSANLPLDRVVQAALDGMIAAIAADLALLFLQEGDSLLLKGFKPKSRKIKVNDIPVHRVGECLCGLAVKEGQPIYSFNIHKDRRCTWDECKKAGFVSFCAIPIYSGETILGVLALASNSERDFRKQVNFLNTLSNEIATSLQNALLFQQVQHHATELESQIKERKKAETALCKSTARLQALSHRLLEVQETERRTIARELHDEIGQTLTALKINLQTFQSQINTALSQKQMEESVQLVEQALQQARNLSLDLRPSILDDLGLLPALRWYLDRQSQRTGMAVEISASEFKTSLPPEVEIACFRIIQEALTNVARHAKAKQVWIKLSEVNKKLQMVVRDDGGGFDVNAAYKRASLGASLGLLGMEERVQLAGGKIEIQSQPGQGTEIKVYFPLSENKPAVQKSKGKVKS